MADGLWRSFILCRSALDSGGFKEQLKNMKKKKLNMIRQKDSAWGTSKHFLFKTN